MPTLKTRAKILSTEAVQKIIDEEMPGFRVVELEPAPADLHDLVALKASRSLPSLVKLRQASRYISKVSRECSENAGRRHSRSASRTSNRRKSTVLSRRRGFGMEGVTSDPLALCRQAIARGAAAALPNPVAQKAAPRLAHSSRGARPPTPQRGQRAPKHGTCHEKWHASLAASSPSGAENC